MTIEKISNIQITLTDDVINRKWNDVIIKRNKLLSISDWTQLSDAPITKEMRNIWTKWRQKVRQVKKSTIVTSEKAEELLKILELQIPEKIQYIPSEEILPVEESVPQIIEPDFTLVDNKLQSVKEELLSKIVSMHDIDNVISDRFTNNNETLLNMIDHMIELKLKQPIIIEPPKSFEETKTELLNEVHMIYHRLFSEYTEVDNEKFKQAVDYLVDKAPNEKHYPLLQLYFVREPIDKLKIVKQIILDRNKWLQNVCKFEEDRLNYTNRIMVAQNDTDLDIIRTELAI